MSPSCCGGGGGGGEEEEEVSMIRGGNKDEKTLSFWNWGFLLARRRRERGGPVVGLWLGRW